MDTCDSWHLNSWINYSGLHYDLYVVYNSISHLIFYVDTSIFILCFLNKNKTFIFEFFNGKINHYKSSLDKFLSEQSFLLHTEQNFAKN